MQKQLAATDAAVRVLHEQKRDDSSRHAQLARFSSSATAFSQPWQSDLIERQMRETERRRHESRYEPRRESAWPSSSVTSSRHHVPETRHRFEEDLLAAQDRNRVLQVELVRMRENKAALEAEALAFKQRMEHAVGSFEGIIEQAVDEKARTFQQLLAAKQQLQTARQQLKLVRE